MEITLLKVVIAFLLLTNILVSVLLLRRLDLSNIYKVTMGLAVWFLPFIGALSVWALNKSHDDFSSNNPGRFQDNSTHGSVSENYDSGGGDGGGGE